MSEEDVKDGPHLTLRLTDAGFESCALKFDGALLDINIGADVIHGVMRFQCVQKACISDAFAHTLQFLSVGNGQIKSMHD